jgi:hypothetical protein
LIAARPEGIVPPSLHHTMNDDPERTPRPSGTWAAAHDTARRRAEQMRDAALRALDARDFARAILARDLQLKGEALAEQTTDWKRLAPDNPFRLAALTELLAFGVQVESVLKGEG